MSDVPLMNVPRSMPPIAPVVIDLINCVCEMLATNGQGPTCWCGVYPGASVSWEECGDCGDDVCGMGYVRPGTTTPYDVFPFSVIDENCVKPLAYELEVGVLRCFPTMDDDGAMPPADVTTEAAMGLLQDQYALYQAIMCCEGLKTKAISAWQPIGPQGNCVGGFWTVYVDEPLAR